MEFEKNNITLEEIKKANKWDLLDAVYENDIKYLKKHKLNIERGTQGST